MDHAADLDQKFEVLQEDKNSTNILIKTEFKSIVKEIEDSFKEQNETIKRQKIDVEEAREVADDLVKERNRNQSEVAEIAFEVEELRLWKEKITNQQVSKSGGTQENEEPTKMEIEDTNPKEENERIKQQSEDNNDTDKNFKEENRTIVTAAQKISL